MQITYLTDWELTSHFPNVPLMGFNVETGVALSSITPPVRAKVPGSIYRDLLDAGLIEDPYYEMNSMKCEWVANRWWIYAANYAAPAARPAGRIHLVLEGVDYRVRVYCAGRLLGIHEGMGIPAEYDVTDILHYGEENPVVIMLENAPEEMGQIGFTSKTKIVKSRYQYKWDFSTRMVSMGLYKPVYFKETGAARLLDTRISATPLGGGEASLAIEAALDGDAAACRLEYRLSGYGVDVRGFADGAQAADGRLAVRLNLHGIHTWQVNGRGEHPLYHLELKLMDADGCSDSREHRVGFKTLEVVANEDAPADALPYTFVVNGEKMYVKGVNMTPMDLMSNYVPKERYRDFVRLLAEGNINLIRVWGGGFIESESLYDACDEAGILLWQEFSQSSSGIDNTPSKDPYFMQQLQKASIAGIQEKRNHVSLAAWSGGNELTDDNKVPATMEDENLAALKKLVDTYDPGRYMYPTSASGPNEFCDPDDRGHNHDVHGHWKYLGTPGQYHFYNQSDSLFHSEFGVDGLTNYASMCTVLAEENRKVCSPADNYTWRHHGETWETLVRDETVFGKFASLSDYILASQFIQGEGLRYALEANRRRAYQNSGSIVWQSNEPWPNIGCTCLIDYYNRPKLAYHMVAQAFQPVQASLRYDKLIWEKGETCRAELFVTSDDPVEAVAYTLRVLDDSGACVYSCEGAVEAGDGRSVKAASVEVPMQDTSALRFVLAASNSRRHGDTTVLLFAAQEGGKASIKAVRDYVTDCYPMWEGWKTEA